MNPSIKKVDRLLQIEALLLAHPKGLTQAELARRLEVNRSTIGRYLPNLPKHVYIDDLDGGRWKIDRSAYLVNVRFNLHEATALHLACRLLANRLDKQNPHAAAALRKLGIALNKLAPHVSQHILQSAEQMDDQHKRLDPNFNNVLETLTLAWAEQRKVSLWHRHTDFDKVYPYTFSPYFIEPYAAGNSLHVIGYREPPGKVRTLKIERIEQATLLQETYQIPPDFDATGLLSQAWGIWYTEKEPVWVRLRFSQHVARRVLENQWHRQEETEPQVDGSLIWQAPIAEPLEMLPWIRGWGADVEVLAPEGLRKKMIFEFQQMGKVYKMEKMDKILLAHLREKDQMPQALYEHLEGVSEKAGQFANKIGLGEIGNILGMFHDLGKASQEFQNYIQSAVGFIKPGEEGYVNAQVLRGQIDHSTAGAQLIYQQLNKEGGADVYLAQIMSLCIASHHSGLIDCLKPNGENNFLRRITQAEDKTHTQQSILGLEEGERASLLALLENKSVTEKLINKIRSLKQENDDQSTYMFKIGLLIRFLFSCLIDADRLDTADFEFPQNVIIRNHGNYASWESLIARLNAKIAQFEQKENKNEVDHLRNEVSETCFAFANKPKGIYTLSVPTGGGKTLASLRFALNHAHHHQMDHIFYIIPFTSIIDQNAKEVRKILEDRDETGKFLNHIVLEHHSNLTPEEETRRHKLLAENWDAPLVFTTMVQFLETLFGSGTRNTRRMHQLANSVIIFDEIQTIPVRCVHMFNIAIRFLVEACGATVVLCTATQPLLDKIDSKYRKLPIEESNKIISNEKELFEKLNRVQVFDRLKVEGWSEEEIANLVIQELEQKGNVLVIVNTRASARTLYQLIKSNCSSTIYHLSTNMCPAHRINVLEEVREKLDNKEPVICISTQLIEAGVDIDFDSVIRYVAGMDSIIQAAGRCNRHGLKDIGTVTIVNPEQENINYLKDIKIGIEKTKRILDEFTQNPAAFSFDLLGKEIKDAYYQYYFYDRKDDMNYPVTQNSIIGQDDNLFNLLSLNNIAVNEFRRIHQAVPDIPFKQSFGSAAKAFFAIDSPTRGVVVPYGEEGKELINDLCGAFDLSKQLKLLKKAQRYSVNLFPHELKKLASMGVVHETQKESGVLYLDENYYNKELGWRYDSGNNTDLLIC